MDLETLTSGRYIRVNLEADRKERAIELLLDCLLAEGALPTDCRSELLESVMRRERSLSTGLEHGIAIPHGTTTRIRQEVAALGVFPRGVPFETVDGHVPRIVILIITPEARRYHHVIQLGSIAKQLLLPDVRAALLEAATEEDALTALRFRPLKSGG